MNQDKLEVVKQQMAKVNFDFLGNSKLKWTGMGEFNSDDHYIYYCGQESLRRNGVAIMVNKSVRNAVIGCNLKNDRMISVRFQGKPFNITVIQVYAPTTNAEEAEVEWFYEDLQDLLEVTPKKDVLFIIGDWNTKVGSQEIPGVTGRFGLGIQNETGQRLTENSSCLGLPRWYHLILGRLLSLPGFPLLCYSMENLPCSKKGQSWVFISFSHRSLSCLIFSI